VNLQLLYERLKTRELEFYQEIQEMKNLNPFKISHLKGLKHNSNNEKVNLVNFEKKVDPQKKKNNNDSLKKKFEMIVEQICNDYKTKESKIGHSIVPYEIVMNVSVENSGAELIMEAENINWYIKRKDRREELLNKMNNNQVELDDFYEHEQVKGFYDDSTFQVEEINEIQAEQQNKVDYKDNMEIEALKKELVDIKKMLQQEKVSQVNDPSNMEIPVGNDVSVAKKERKITFRDIQKAENIQSTPTKKLKTITKINRYKKPESITQQNEKEKDKNKKQVMKQPTNPTPTSENIGRKK